MIPLAPGAAIGILGGGQLGRMLALAAARLGFDCHVYTPEADSCAARVAARTTVAAYEDTAALAEFADAVSVVTFEFENVPAATLEILAGLSAPTWPPTRSLATAQDRLVEKRFFNDLGIETAPFAAVSDQVDLAAAMHRIGAPAILKTRRLGYDGKGQARVANAEDSGLAFDSIAAAPAILEGFVAFEREISVVAARTRDGAFAAYDVCENTHADGMLASTVVPARVTPAIAAQAQRQTRTVMDALGHVGVLALEFFLTPDGRLLANEFAPRVHNSGHWTEDACLTGQFEQHMRAVAGWPLGSTERLADVEMRNLVGADVEHWASFAADAAARVHLYGKREARQGRKMGHVTRLRPLA